MKHQQVEKKQTGLYGVVGELSFESVLLVEKEGWQAIDDVEDQLTMDLSGVTLCSSAALALLLSWVRYAQHRHKTLIFSRIPHHLSTLIEGANIQSLLVISPEVA